MLMINLTFIILVARVYCDNQTNLTHPIKPVEYNIYEWVKNLNLQTCVLVEIGLKYFAIFVEDASTRCDDGKNMFFLGVCHLNTLKQWHFCTPELERLNQRKCSFRLKRKQFYRRVHRRFCDFSIMIKNKDCKCKPNVFGEILTKVIGLPTCFITPLPYSLCRNYNVCGINKCQITLVENRIFSVQCDPKCVSQNYFCDDSEPDNSSLSPKVTSEWSKWKLVNNPNSSLHSIATCVNKLTGEGGVDCLGPGTNCFSCNPYSTQCVCTTYIEDGVLKTERYISYNQTDHYSNGQDFLEFPYIVENQPKLRVKYSVKNHDDKDDDEDEDILIEDITEPEVTTEETLEREEINNILVKEKLEHSNLTFDKVASNCDKLHNSFLNIPFYLVLIRIINFIYTI